MVADAQCGHDVLQNLQCLTKCEHQTHGGHDVWQDLVPFAQFKKRGGVLLLVKLLAKSL